MSTRDFKIRFIVDEVLRPLMYTGVTVGFFIGSSVATGFFCFFMMKYNNRNRTLRAVNKNLEDSKQSKERHRSQERLIAQMQSEISVLKLKVRKLDQLVKKYIENKNTTQDQNLLFNDGKKDTGFAEQQEEQLEEEQVMEPLTPRNERTGAIQRLSCMDQLQLSDL